MAENYSVTDPLTPSPNFSDDQSGEFVLHFPLGLPGFETSKQFVLRAQPSLAPVACLQSTDSPDLCFLVVPVATLVTDYSLSVSPDDLRTLELDPDGAIETHTNLLCLAILTVPEDGSLTANLLAPVIVNLAANLAVQAVRADTMYSHRHPITSLQSASGGGELEVSC